MRKLIAILTVCSSYLACDIKEEKPADPQLYVYILAGESNAEGAGNLDTLSEDRRRVPINVEFWQNGKRATYYYGWFGPEVTLIECLSIKHSKRQIVFIKRSNSESSLYYAWYPDRYDSRAIVTQEVGKSHQYSLMLDDYQKIMDGREHVLKTLYFMQGEQDRKFLIAAESYASNWQYFKDSVIADIGIIDFVAGRIITSDYYSGIIRTAQSSADNILVDLDHCRNDGLHFISTGYECAGVMFFYQINYPMDTTPRSFNEI
jgi:hypothetical protein